MISQSQVIQAICGSPEDIGRLAGERAVRRLKPRKIESQAVPVIFDRRVASSLAGHLIGAVIGLGCAQNELS